MTTDFSQAQLLGQDEGHLVCLPDGQHLTSATAAAFLSMQQAARQEGLELAIASGYRSFERQLLIWNGKFRGERPLLDADSQPLDPGRMNDQQKVDAILRWSALPGASRHHWGTDLDLYAPNLLPAGQRLRLETWEYGDGGYFEALTAWLDAHMADFGFYRPYTGTGQGVGNEPWHLSFAPESHQAERLLRLDSLTACLQTAEIEGKACILAQLPTLWRQLTRHNPEDTP